MTKKHLKTQERLIRITRQRMDQQRIFLMQIDGRLERVRQEKERLESHLTHEENISHTSLEASVAFPAYAQKMKATLDHLSRQEREITLQLAQEKEKMMTFFADLTAYEKTKKNTQNRMAADILGAEQEALDDLNQTLFEQNQP